MSAFFRNSPCFTLQVFLLKAYISSCIKDLYIPFSLMWLRAYILKNVHTWSLYYNTVNRTSPLWKQLSSNNFLWRLFSWLFKYYIRYNKKSWKSLQRRFLLDTICIHKHTYRKQIWILKLYILSSSSSNFYIKVIFDFKCTVDTVR